MQLINTEDAFRVIERRSNTGKFSINPQFDSASQFSEGLAVISNGGRYGYIDKTSKYVINPQFDGRTTQLVPEATLTSGEYTQVRLGVQSATIVTDTGQQLPVEIPSGNLKTDKNFDFDVTGGRAVALTVDFDLSKSIVVTGSGKYQLKPVLHLVRTEEAATVTGSIAAVTFGAQNQATIIVTQDSDNSGGLTPGDEEYTRLVVAKGPSGPTPFSIYWLVPNQTYIVQLQIGGSIVYSQTVAGTSLPAAAVYPLNNGNPI